MHFKSMLPWLRLAGAAIVVFAALFLIIRRCGSSGTPPKKSYVIAYPTRWQNIPLYGTEQSVVGFSSDLVYAIAEQMGLTIQLISADQDSFPAKLDHGEVDGVLTPIPVNTATQQFYEFTTPYFVTGTVVVVPTASPFVTSKDLKSALIGFDRADGSEIVVGARPTWILHPYDSATAAIDAAISGKLDGVILNFINASRLTHSLFRTKIRILLPPLVTQNVRLAVRRGKNHELVELFNQGVHKFIKSGQYKELLEYWNIESPLPSGSA